MSTSTDWTIDLISYGDSRGWSPLPRRRALASFAAATGTERRTGIAADRALRLGYAALAAATGTQRARVRDWSGVLDLQREQQATRERSAIERGARLRAEMDAMADQAGWLLLAGEDTAMVASGTRDHVASMLPAVTRMRRDHHIGCWVILAPDGREYMAGKFSRTEWWIP